MGSKSIKSNLNYILQIFALYNIGTNLKKKSTFENIGGEKGRSVGAIPK